MTTSTTLKRTAALEAATALVAPTCTDPRAAVAAVLAIADVMLAWLDKNDHTPPEASQ